METVNLLAGLWGLYLVAVPLSLLMNPRLAKELMFQEKESTLVIWGAVALMLGALTIALNGNVWGRQWETLVTVFGWASALKGVWLLFMTRKAKAFAEASREKDWVSYALLASVLVGLATLYFSYAG